MQRCTRFSGTIPTADERPEEEAHPAAFRSVLAWQVQPSQVQMFANTASQPTPHPAWGGGGGPVI